MAALRVAAWLALAPWAGYGSVSAGDGSPARRVVIISLDGLRPDAIDAAGAPTLLRLLSEGAYDPTCINEFPPATLPNHASMATGLRVGGHLVLANTDLPGFISAPTIFDRAAAQGLRVGFFASKSKLGYLCRPESAAVRVLENNIHLLTEQTVQALQADPPDLTFLHLGEPDGAGHREGWMSDAYLAVVREVDALVAQVVAAVENAGLRAETVLVVTADHGGQGRSHFLNTPVERFVPLILWGADVRVGHALCRPTFVRDVAAIAANCLRLDSAPFRDAVFPHDAFAGAEAEGAACATQPFLPVVLPCAVIPLGAAGVAWLVCCAAGRQTYSGDRT